jgi:hypothetical protein
VAEGVCEEPGGCSQTLVVGGLSWQVGEEVAEPTAREPQPAALRVAAEQELSDGQADQLGIREARRSTRALSDAKLDEEVVDFDVEGRDEGVELRCHTSLFGALALLVTACFLLVADWESFI